MALFEGSVQEFHRYLGPRIRNAINLFVSEERKARNGICEHCNKSGNILDAAHIHGRDRRSIIEQILASHQRSGIVRCDIELVEREILNGHGLIADTFKFLCKECHIQYDNFEKPRNLTLHPVESLGGVANRNRLLSERAMRKARRDDQGKLSEDVAKQEAIDFVNARYPNTLPDKYTYFANINHGPDVWWLEIPLVRVESPTPEQYMHILLYDYRTHMIHHLQVPILFMKENSKNGNFFIRQKTNGKYIQLHLSSTRSGSDFLRDTKSDSGHLHFARFTRDPPAEK